LSKIARKVIGQSQMASEFNDYKGSPLCAFLSRYIISDQRFFSFFCTERHMNRVMALQQEVLCQRVWHISNNGITTHSDLHVAAIHTLFT